MAPALAAVPAGKTGPVEIAFKSPGQRPNGLQATADGLWIIDQGPGSRAYLVRYADGQAIRSFDTDTVRPSGLTFDGQALWIGSTFSYENVRCDATTGAVLERRPTPGCTTYQMADDPAPRRSPLAHPPAARLQRRRPRRRRLLLRQLLCDSRSRRTCASRAPTARNGATASCGRHRLHRDRSIEIDPQRWVVERVLHTPGPRPHGLAWEGRYLWHNDGDLNAFFKFDPDTGQIVEKIQLADSDPLSHGLTIWEGTLWYCDDVGVVCRMKI